MVFCLWLLTALLISIEVGSYLKSSFSTTTYDLIDSYQDAIQRDNVHYWRTSDIDTMMHCNKEEWMKYKGPCRNLYFKNEKCSSILDLGKNSSRHDVFVTSLKTLKLMVQREIKKIHRSGRLFHLAKDKMYHCIYFRGHNLQSDYLKENLILSGLTYFETKPLAYKDFQIDSALDTILWQKPTEEGTVLYLEDCTVVFNIFLIGILISCAVLALEAIVYFTFGLCKGKPTRYADRQRIQFLD